MLKFTEHQRLTYAEKTHDLANLAIAGLVFGQFIGDEPFSVALVGVGVVIYLFLTITAFTIDRKIEKA